MCFLSIIFTARNLSCLTADTYQSWRLQLTYQKFRDFTLIHIYIYDMIKWFCPSCLQTAPFIKSEVKLKVTLLLWTTTKNYKSNMWFSVIKWKYRTQVMLWIAKIRPVFLLPWIIWELDNLVECISHVYCLKNTVVLWCLTFIKKKIKKICYIF